MNGYLVINKEKGITSYDCIRKIKKILKEKEIKTKIGHAGTLDPFAEGILIVLLGRYTRLMDYFMFHSKTYEGEFIQGFKSNTGDLTGEIIEEKELIKSDRILSNTKNMLGKNLQRPHFFSAVKHNGKKLYEYARKGEYIEKEPKEIYVNEFFVEKIDEKTFSFSVSVSSGTYVRSLIEDYIESLGGLAYLTKLNRVRVGNISLNDSIKISELNKDNIDKNIKEIKENTFDLPKITLTKEDRDSLKNGIKVRVDERDIEDVLLIENDEIFAIGCVKENVLRTKLFIKY